MCATGDESQCISDSVWTPAANRLESLLCWEPFFLWLHSRVRPRSQWWVMHSESAGWQIAICLCSQAVKPFFSLFWRWIIIIVSVSISNMSLISTITNEIICFCFSCLKNLKFEEWSEAKQFRFSVCGRELWMLIYLHECKVLVWRFSLDAVGCLRRMFIFRPEGNFYTLSSIKLSAVGSAVLHQHREPILDCF